MLQTIRANAYTVLLSFLTLLLVAGSILYSSETGRLLVDVLLLLVLFLLAITLLPSRGRAFWLYISAATATTILDALGEVSPPGTVTMLVSTVASALGYLVLVVASLVVMIRHIALARSVTRDTILGSVCVYLLLGFLFYVVYQAIFDVHPMSFKGVSLKGEYDLIYYSFNTLTTMGNGDILPTSRLTMALCNLEAIVGQMFLAIFVARLVSLFVISRAEKTVDQ